MRNLGLDIGSKRIGVVISDSEQILASPLKTVIRDNDEKAIEAILGLVNEYDVQRIIIGLPYSLNGNIGNQACIFLQPVLGDHLKINNVDKAVFIEVSNRVGMRAVAAVGGWIVNAE